MSWRGFWGWFRGDGLRGDNGHRRHLDLPWGRGDGVVSDHTTNGAEDNDKRQAVFLLFVTPGTKGAVDFVIEGRPFDGLRSGGEDDDGDKGGVFEDGFERGQDRIEARLFVEWLLGNKGKDTSGNARLVLDGPGAEREFAGVQFIIVSPNSDGIAGTDLALHAGMEELIESRGQARGSLFHGPGVFDNQKKTVLGGRSCIGLGLGESEREEKNGESRGDNEWDRGFFRKKSHWCRWNLERSWRFSCLISSAKSLSVD